MKRFNLLLRNAVRIMWKFKFLVLQLILLLMIAITILSSVFLSNKSLETSYNNFKKEGVYPQFSVANKQLNSKLEYNLKSPNSATPNDIIDENSVFELNSSTNVTNGDTPNKDGYEIYNPLVKNTLPTSDPTKPLNVYGFVKSYEGYNVNPTPDDTSVFQNMVYSYDYRFNVFLNTFKTNQKYKDRLYSLYSFYNKGLYNSMFQKEFEQGNFSKLYDESIYAFNPWSLRYNGENIDVSPTGLARLKNVNLVNENNDVSMFNSIYDKNNEQIVGFDNSFRSNISQPEKDLLNKEVYFNEESSISPTVNKLLTVPNNIKQISPSTHEINGQPLSAFETFLYWIGKKGWLIATNNNPISQQYFQFNKDLFNNLKGVPTDNANIPNQSIKNYKTTSNQEFIFDYKINPENIEGIPEYFVKNPIPSFNVENKNIFDTSGFFEGQIGIPIIPYLTVSPKEGYTPNEQVLQQPIDYKLGNWLPNYSNIKSYLFSTVGYLKNNVINKLKDYVDYVKNNYNNPKYVNNEQWKLVQAWYNNYLSQYDIEGFLKNTGALFSKTSNFVLDSLEQSSIIASYDDQQLVNKISLKSGLNILPNNGITLENNDGMWNHKLDPDENANPNTSNLLTRTQWLGDKIYNFFKIMSESKLELNEKENNFIKRITSWLGNPINTSSWDLYIKVRDYFKSKYFIKYMQNIGYGYRFAFNASADIQSIKLEQVGEYVPTSSYTVILSQNYTEVQNGHKKPINSDFLNNALLLPSRSYIPTQEEINQDPFKWKKHYIYNPYNKKTEFYVDFLDWKSRLPKNVLFTLNNVDYVIIGTGLSPEYMYPITSSNQMLINNNVPIVYVNSLGFDFIKQMKNVNMKSNYWVHSYGSNYSSRSLIYEINNKFRDVYKMNLAYDIEDSKQPDKLLYTRMNFSRNIMHIIFTITITIGVIIALLSLSFLVVLLRSIIKQNLNSFAIGLSNGISKKELVFSFFPMALIPSFIASIIGYVISLFLYPLITNAISSYWVLTISPIVFSILVFVSLFLISSLLMFLTIVVIVYHTLRYPIAVLLSSAGEYKVNKLMQWTKPMFSKMGSLASFRGSFIFNNFGRFLTLTTLMTLFMTFSSMFVSLKSTFNNATQQTIKNKDYNFSIDLYSPTMSNGYYSTFGYDRIGTSHEGFSPEIGEPYSPIYTGWDPSKPRPSNVDANKINYREPLTFHNPLDDNDHSKDIFYSNLSLPSVSMVSDIVNNLNFFKNKIWIREFLDININFLGIDINPWAWAKKAIPEAILSTVDKRFNEQIFDALSYYYYQFNNKESLINKADKVDNQYRHGHFDKASYYWYTDANQAQHKNRSLVDDIKGNKQQQRDPKNPDTWNQNGWYFKLKKVNGRWVWKTDINDINFGLPTYASKPDFIKLVVNILSFPSNGLYKEYWKQEHNNQEVINRNSFLGMNFIPFDKEKNQLYTYLDGLNLNENKSINIKGIDPIINLQKPIKDEPKFYLYDQYHDDKNLVEDLKSWDQTNFNNSMDVEKTEFPLIINEVVAKKYEYKTNDVIRVRINNTYDRFKKRFLNEEEKPVSFKIIGITTSKSEEQYFTSQKVANYLLRFTEPVVKTKQQIFETSDYNAWALENIPAGKKPFDIYTPFNGIITSETTPMLLNNLLCFYSPSGMNPLTSDIPISYIRNDSQAIISNNWSNINKIIGFDIINTNSNPSLYDVVNIFSKNYYRTFLTKQYIVSNLQNINVTFSSKLIGKIMDKTIGDIMSVIIVSFIPTLIIIILLLSFVIIQEARRIIALLKVLGYGDWTNAVSLSFIYYLVLGISLLFNIGFNYLLSYLFSTMAFSLFNIIVNPIAPWWIYVATFGCLLLLLVGLTSSIFYKLKKATLIEEINVR